MLPVGVPQQAAEGGRRYDQALHRACDEFLCGPSPSYRCWPPLQPSKETFVEAGTPQKPITSATRKYRAHSVVVLEVWQ